MYEWRCNGVTIYIRNEPTVGRMSSYASDSIDFVPVPPVKVETEHMTRCESFFACIKISLSRSRVLRHSLIRDVFDHGIAVCSQL